MNGEQERISKEELIRYDSVRDIAIAPHGGPRRYPAHWHNSAEFTLALEDGCDYLVQNTRYCLKKGDLLLVWPGDLHETVSVPEGAAVFIQFSDRLLDLSLDLAAARRHLSRVKLISREENPELADRLAGLIRELMDNYNDSRPFSETRCKLLVYQMLLLVGNHVYKTKKRQLDEDPLSMGSWNRMREACAYIESHYAEDIRQDQVAAAAGLSVCYFSRLFRKYAGCSFPQYLSHVRVRAAARLLGQTGLSVTECAGQAGFQSITTFNKCFLEEMSIAPRDYRKMYRR